MSTPFPDPIIKPFSNTGDNTPPPLGPISTAANQETGFPILEATPLDAGGIEVTREEFNGALNFYTQQILALTSGAQYTFDADVSTQQNGYPQGAILYDFSTKMYQRSLVNNNTANFVTNPSYLNDGINWSGLFSANDIVIKPTTNFEGLTIYSTNPGFFVTFAADPLQNYVEIFRWPKTAPIADGTYALSKILVSATVESKWVPIKTRITYTAPGVTTVPPGSFLKFNSFYDSYNLNTSSPYNPSTGIFTAPHTGIFKFETNLFLSALGGMDLFIYNTTPAEIAGLTTAQNLNYNSGITYCKLNSGDQVGVYSILTNPTITIPATASGIDNQLSISWNT